MTYEPGALTRQIASMTSRLALFKMEVTQLQNELRSLKNIAIRMDKHFYKHQAKTARKTHASVDRPKPSRGFARPSLLSPDMYAFLNIEPGTLVARTDVTRALTAYIRTHNLYRKPEDGRKKQIYPDESLAILLNIPDDSDSGANVAPLTYWTMQKYLNPHFIRNVTS